MKIKEIKLGISKDKDWFDIGNCKPQTIFNDGVLYIIFFKVLIFIYYV
jgi:hypothetical protein